MPTIINAPNNIYHITLTQKEASALLWLVGQMPVAVKDSFALGSWYYTFLDAGVPEADYPSKPKSLLRNWFGG